MKIGVLTASVSRQAGGVVASVRELCRSISAYGSVSIFSGLDKHSEEDKQRWNPLSVITLPVSGPKSFGYMAGLTDALERSHLDLLHVHGLWMYPSVEGHRWAKAHRKPYVISPHGMLDSWALRNAQWKKRLASVLYEDANLKGAACLHALCDAELKAIRAYGLSNPVCVIPNGIDLPESQTGTKSEAQPLSRANGRALLYLGRIHPKKGLTNLLHAWKMAAQGFGVPGPWVLVIAGWDQGGHETELKLLAARLGISSSVLFVGPQFDEAKRASYAHADAFVLPSFSEGLPMVVLEAWAHRLPVLMTHQCNLPEGFASRAAVQIKPEVGSIAAGLKTLFALPDHERLAMGARGQQLVEERFRWPHIAKQMLMVYRWVLGQGPKPGCVISERG